MASYGALFLCVVVAVVWGDVKQDHVTPSSASSHLKRVQSCADASKPCTSSMPREPVLVCPNNLHTSTVPTSQMHAPMHSRICKMFIDPEHPAHSQQVWHPNPSHIALMYRQKKALSLAATCSASLQLPRHRLPHECFLPPPGASYEMTCWLLVWVTWLLMMMGAAAGAATAGAGAGAE